MKKYSYILFLCCLYLSCSDKETPCGKINCSGTEKPVSITTINGKGEPVEAASVEIENTRTGKKYKYPEIRPLVLPSSVSYLILIAPEQFSGEGDLVVVSITSKSGKVYSKNIMIKGGYCTCEIQKVSGADLIIID